MIHLLPQWLLDIGSIAGLVTAAFLLIDRLLKGRPSISIGAEPHGHRYLDVSTQPGVEISIGSFGSRHGVYRLSKDGEIHHITRAVGGGPFIVTVPSGSTKRFLLIAVPDDKNRAIAHRYRRTPIWLTWRKASSLWLPQFPVFTIIDNDWLRNVRNEGFELGSMEAPG